jgi:hypothetical protein
MRCTRGSRTLASALTHIRDTQCTSAQAIDDLSASLSSGLSSLLGASAWPVRLC